LTRQERIWYNKGMNTIPPVFYLSRSLDPEGEVRDRFMIKTGSRSEPVSRQMLASISDQVSWTQGPLVVCEAQRPDFKVLASQLLAACPMLDNWAGLSVKLSYNFLATPFMCYRSLGLGPPSFEEDGLKWVEGLDGAIHYDWDSDHPLLAGNPSLIFALSSLVQDWLRDHPVVEPDKLERTA